MSLEIRVRVFPGARREGIEENDGTFMVRIKEVAERGEANARVRKILAFRFGVPLAQVRIVAGHRSQKKRIVIS